jgi:hypothetical protein
MCITYYHHFSTCKCWSPTPSYEICALAEPVPVAYSTANGSGFRLQQTHQCVKRMRQKEEVGVCGKCEVETADLNLEEEKKKRGRSVSFAV